MNQDSDEKKREELLARIKELPEEQMATVLWLIDYGDKVLEMCKAEAMSEETRRALLAKAEERGDLLMKVFVLMEECVHQTL